MAAVEALLTEAASRVTAGLPHPRPSGERLAACRIVAHRGVHDNRTILENTLAAFDRTRTLGVWGAELDVRWTGDGHPMVHHDPDGRRMWNDDRPLESMTWEQARRRLPLVPHLAEVVARVGNRLHLMLELKPAPPGDLGRRRRILAETLAPLEPRRDYHLLSDDPRRFEVAAFAPPAACLPIARFNVRRMSRLALSRMYGGITGHYWLIDRSTLARHRRHGQQVGTGFVDCRACLLREAARGVRWLFSNRADRLQPLLDRLLVQGGEDAATGKAPWGTNS